MSRIVPRTSNDGRPGDRDLDARFAAQERQLPDAFGGVPLLGAP
jgi:hypothetical protein